MKVGHISNLFYTEPYAKLASKLVPASGMAAAFFGNSGAEANEGMIKTAPRRCPWQRSPHPAGCRTAGRQTRSPSGPGDDPQGAEG